MSSQIDTIDEQEIDLAVTEPPMFKVIYLNDGVTTYEFVIDSLMNKFSYNQEDAIIKTQNIHDEGSAVVAILPHEIAEQKGTEVIVSARALKFPLQINLEPTL